MRVELTEPWLGFLREVDRGLSQPVVLHCLGGFILAALWGLPRPTGDIDFIEIEPSKALTDLLLLAGEESELQNKYKLHFHQVTIAEYPEGYSSRLIDITPMGMKRLQLMAFEVHDLILAKLSRNSPRDRSDVEFLARKGVVDPRSLKRRFEVELRPYLLNEQRDSKTLELWLDEYFSG